MAHHNHDWKQWAEGLIGSVINAMSTSVTLVIVDPKNFSDWRQLGTVAIVNAIIGAALYLKQSPLPPHEPSDAPHP